MCFFVISFQATQGSGFFIYVAEVCADAANGLCLFTLMFCLVVLSYCCPVLISIDSFGVDGILLTLTCV